MNLSLLGWAGLARAWGCSGPGAAEAMVRAELGGWGLVVLTVAMVAAATLRSVRLGHGARLMAGGWILVLAHPGIWMSARSGDCGMARVESGLLFTLLAAMLGLWGMFRKTGPQEASEDDSPRP